jgi:hypothetical protein
LPAFGVCAVPDGQRQRLGAGEGKTRPRIRRRCGVDLVRLLVATACPVA